MILLHPVNDMELYIHTDKTEHVVTKTDSFIAFIGHSLLVLTNCC